MTMIWLRRYPTMQHLSFFFGIPVSCVHKILHYYLKILHAHLVPKYIKWHSMQKWRQLSGVFPDWPRAVAILDGTPFRISKPKGEEKCHYKDYQKFFTYVVDKGMVQSTRICSACLTYFFQESFSAYTIDQTDIVIS